MLDSMTSGFNIGYNLSLEEDFMLLLVLLIQKWQGY